MKIPAPDLQLSDLESQPVALADYTGQVLVVNNWATWCPPCKEEMPALQAYYEAHRRQGLLVIAIEAGDPAAEVVKFVQDYGLKFPVWLDPRQQAVMAFRNNHLPNTYVIDRSGMIRLAWTGAVNLDVLEKYVTPLLEER
jgi:peroxiredoxin